ncbi:hypothetical protein E4U25_004620, partial [Claviceps purpurea]
MIHDSRQITAGTRTTNRIRSTQLSFQMIINGVFDRLDDLIFQILLDFMLPITYTIRNIGAFLTAESNLAPTNATWL